MVKVSLHFLNIITGKMPPDEGGKLNGPIK